MGTAHPVRPTADTQPDMPAVVVESQPVPAGSSRGAPFTPCPPRIGMVTDRGRIAYFPRTHLPDQD